MPLYRNRSHGYSSVSSPLDPSSDLQRRCFPRAVTNPNGTARVTVPFGPFALAHELVRLIGANKIFRAIRLGLLPGLLGPIPSRGPGTFADIELIHVEGKHSPRPLELLFISG